MHGRRERLLAYGVLPLAILLVVQTATPLVDRDQGFDIDGLLYAAMAHPEVGDASLSHTAPYCWRVLTPWIVSLLPLDVQHVIHAFQIVAFASIWITLAGLYAVLVRCGLGTVGRVGGVLLYAGVFWTVKFAFYSPCYVDFQMQTFVVLVLLCMLARRYWLAALLLTVAVMQREAILYLIPVVAVHNWRTRRPELTQFLGWLAATILAPLIVLAGLRAAIEPVNDHSLLNTLDYFLNGQLLAAAFWPKMALALFSGLGLLPLLLVFTWRDALRVLRDQPHWGVMIASGLVLLAGGVDKARLLLPVVPPLVILGASGLERAFGDAGIRRNIGIVATLYLHFYLGAHFTGFDSYETYLERMVPIYAGAPPWAGLADVAMVAGLWLLGVALLGSTREWVLGGVALPLLIVGSVWLTTPVTENNAGFDADGQFYGAMVIDDPRLAGMARQAPFCYRVLTPWIAHQVQALMPPDVGVTPAGRALHSFTVVAFVSTWLTLAALFALLRSVGVRPGAAVCGVLLYAGVFWTAKFAFYSPAYLDAQAMLLLLAGLLLMERGRYWWLLPLLAIGVVQRETALLLVPLAIVHVWKARGRLGGSELLLAAALAIVPLLVLAGVRASITPANKYDLLSALHTVATAQLPDPAFWLRVPQALLSGLGVLPAILVAFPRTVGAFWRRCPHWPALILLTVPLLFFGYEKSRYLLPAVPALAVAGAAVIDRVLRERGQPGALCVTGIIAIHLYVGHHLTAIGSFQEYLTWLVPMHAGGSFVPGLLLCVVMNGLVLGTAGLLRALPGVDQPVKTQAEV